MTIAAERCPWCGEVIFRPQDHEQTRCEEKRGILMARLLKEFRERQANEVTGAERAFNIAADKKQFRGPYG